MPTISRSIPNDPAFVQRLAEEYAKAKEFAEKAAKHADSLKKQLSEIVDTNGDSDEKGNRWFEVDGYDLKRERRVSRSLDTTRAKKWAEDNNVWNEVREIVEQLSEERLLHLAWERAELAPEVAGLYNEKEVWAFKLIEKKDDNNDGD